MAENDYTSWQGRTVYGSDGDKIGKIADLYDDDSGGQPAFATVHTGLFGTRTSFVPLTSAEVRGDDVVVPYSKQKVQDAPRIDADAEVSDDEVREIYRYYELTSGSNGSSTGATGTAAGAGNTAGAAGATTGADYTDGAEGYDT